MLRKLLFVFLLFFISFNTHAQNIEVQRLNYSTQDLSSIDKVVVKNSYGDIRIRQTKQESIVYHAVSQFSKQHKANLFDSVKDKTLFLEIRYPNPPSSDSKERVDAVIILPKEIQLQVIIEKGNLSTKTIGNELNIQSEHSDINVKTTNSANIFTKTGNIKFSKIPNKASKSIELKTYSGTIRVDYVAKNIPRADVITGSIVTSNSVRFLKNKTIKNRTQRFRPAKAFGMFKVQSDTGLIHFIEHKEI